MAALSLSQFLQLKGAIPNRGIRLYCAPGKKTIGLNSPVTMSNPERS